MKCRVYVGLVALVSCLAANLVGCATQGGGGYSPPPTVIHDSTLSEGDVFEVTVYGEKELSGRHRVARGGDINFPLVGAIAVVGKDQTQVAIAIQNALKEQNFLRNPHVSVLVTEMESRRVTVLGAVDKPGNFKVAKGMTILQALSIAGGLTPLADKNGTIVTRRSDGKTQRFNVPVGLISEGRENPVEVKAGDTIYVPERIF